MFFNHCTETLIGTVKSLIDEDPRRSLRMLAADLEISKDCVKNIQTVNLGLHEVCSVLTLVALRLDTCEQASSGRVRSDRGRK